VEPPETPGGSCSLTLELIAANGVETQAALSVPAPLVTCRSSSSGREVAGTGRLEGSEVRFRAVLSPDWGVLEWHQPVALALRDGSRVELAGRYVKQTEAASLASARLAFDTVDRELNAVYRRLLAARGPAASSAVRADQRRWLVFRDFTLFDGDNADAVGPGTSAHVREQGRRTLARTRFLAALLEPPGTDPGDTLFADGRSGRVAVRRVGDGLAFAAAVQFPSVNAADAPPSVPCTISGVARPSGPNVWLADPDTMAAFDDTWRPEPLRLAFDPEGRLRVEPAGDQPGRLARVLQGPYAPQRRLAPAEAPLRSLLWRLPARAFDDTTEGLSDAERQSLVLTGAGGTFKVAAETPDRLMLRHHDGHVVVLRLAGASGSAVLVVEQTNGRNLSLQVWRQADAASPIVEWRDALPVLPAGAFFEAGSGAEPIAPGARTRQVIHIDGTGTLRLSLQVDGGSHQPDREFILDWDGFGFVVEQGRRPRP
jgi:uncharacterized protein YecT (DUF1311 family)